MAKVSGPLMSVSASGQFAGSMVFGTWKGRPYVRQLVTPLNPRSAGQENARNNTRIFGAIQAQYNRTTQKRAGETMTDKDAIKSMTPTGQAWNGYLVAQGIGVNGTVIDTAAAVYAALTAAEKTAWDTAATAMVPPFAAVAQTEEGGAYIADASAGEVHFIGQYALAVLGLRDTPAATPPTYA